MKIPKKITPDHLKDTIVQILFIPGVPPELILGNFSFLFKDSFKFVASKRLPQPIPGFPSIIERNYYFTDLREEIKVEISENALTFNSLSKYIGWKKYFPLVESTLKLLLENGTIKAVNRIGTRYVSEFPDIGIFEKLQMSIDLNIPNKNFQTTHVRTEYNDDQFKVILNLSNDLLKPNIGIGKPSRFSLIDIDVISFFSVPISNQEQVIDLIDKSHFKQKTIFFSLLTEDFLNSLNPEY